MEEPNASLDDLYKQNETIIGLLERLNENLYLTREAVYGRTADEAGKPYDNPKHGDWGMVSPEQIDSLESALEKIADRLPASKAP